MRVEEKEWKVIMVNDRSILNDEFGCARSASDACREHKWQLRSSTHSSGHTTSGTKLTEEQASVLTVSSAN